MTKFLKKPGASPVPLSSSLDSLEGVPDVFEPRLGSADRHGAVWRGHVILAWVGGVLPGLVLAIALAYAGMVLANFIGVSLLKYDKSPFSPIMIAVVLGLLVRNTVGVPHNYEEGLRVCLRTLLRFGVILLGLGLSIQTVASIGLLGLPIAAACIVTALLVVAWFTRILGLPRRLGTLVAVGTSICGVSAIVATAPAINAEEDETSYAIACITIFGLLALFTYPLLAHWIFDGDAFQASLFLGTAIHDTSQVAGAGLMYDQQFGNADATHLAVVVKLLRNMCIFLVVPGISILYNRSAAIAEHRSRRWFRGLPLFVVFFALMACLRSIGDTGEMAFGFLSHSAWNRFNALAAESAVWCLAAAMAAVGLATSLTNLMKLGLRPLVVGMIAASSVGLVSLLLIKLLVTPNDRG